jgi:hypothetical protein
MTRLPWDRKVWWWASGMIKPDRVSGIWAGVEVREMALESISKASRPRSASRCDH